MHSIIFFIAQNSFMFISTLMYVKVLEMCMGRRGGGGKWFGNIFASYREKWLTLAELLHIFASYREKWLTLAELPHIFASSRENSLTLAESPHIFASSSA